MDDREVELLGSFILPSLEWSDAHLSTMCFRCDTHGQSEEILVPVVSCVALDPEDVLLELKQASVEKVSDDLQKYQLRIIGALRRIQGQHVFEMRGVKRPAESGGLEGEQKHTQKVADNSAIALHGQLLRISPVLHMSFGRLVLLEILPQGAQDAISPSQGVTAPPLTTGKADPHRKRTRSTSKENMSSPDKRDHAQFSSTPNADTNISAGFIGGSSCGAVLVALVNTAALIRPYLRLGVYYTVRGLRKCSWRSGAGPENTPSDFAESLNNSDIDWYVIDDRHAAHRAGMTNTACDFQAVSYGFPWISTTNRSQAHADAFVCTPLTQSFLARLNARCDITAASAALARATEINVIGTIQAVDPNGAWVRLGRASVTSAETLQNPSAVAKIQDAQSTSRTQKYESMSYFDGKGHGNKGEEDGSVVLFLAHRSRPGDVQYSLRIGTRLRAYAVLPLCLWNSLCGLAVTMRSHLSVHSFGPFYVTQPAGLIAPALRRAAHDERRRCLLYSAWKLFSMRQLTSACLASSRLDLLPRVLSSALAWVTGSSSACDVSSADLDTVNLLLLPALHSIQNEFSDHLYAELYALRSGEAAEWLDSILPKVCSLTDLSERVEHLAMQAAAHENVAILNDTRYRTYVHDTAAEPQPVLFVSTVRRVRLLKDYDVPRSDSTVKRAAGMRHVWRKNEAATAVETDDSADEEENTIFDDKPNICSSEKHLAAVPRVLCMLHLEDRMGYSIPLLVHADKAFLKSLRMHLLMQSSSASAAGLFDIDPPAVMVRKSTWVLQMAPGETHEPLTHESRNSFNKTQLLAFCMPQNLYLISEGKTQSGFEDQEDDSSDELLLQWIDKLMCSPADLATALRQIWSPNLIPSASAPSISAAAAVASLRPFGWADSWSVRHALLKHHQLGPATVPVPAVEGWVLSVDAAAIDTKRFSNYNRKNAMNVDIKEYASASGTQSQRCAILLRDLKAADTLKVYVPLRLAQALLPGMAVRLSDCLLTATAAGTVYVNCCQSRCSSAVGILGMQPLERISMYCALSALHPGHKSSADSTATSNLYSAKSSSASGQIAIGARTTYVRGMALLPPALSPQPPRTTVSRLQASRLYNRCQWCLIGRVAHVEKLQVTLKCLSCSISVGGQSSSMGSSLCPQCRSAHDLKCEWTAVMCFDDGTSECFLHVDTVEDVFAFLHVPAHGAPTSVAVAGSRVPSGRGSIDLGQSTSQALDCESLRGLVEDRVRTHGFLRYMHRFRQSRKKMNALHRRPDNAGGTAAAAIFEAGGDANAAFLPYVADDASNYITPEELLQASGDVHGCPEEAMLDDYIAECDFSTPVEVHCRLIFLKNAQGKRLATQSKTIRVQQDNKDKPYIAFTQEQSTFKVEDLQLQVTAVRRMGSRGAHVEAWKQLRALRSLSICGPKR